MADSLEVDLIVQAIAKGFKEMQGDIKGTGDATDAASKKGSAFDKVMSGVGSTINTLKTAAGGARIALAFLEQGFAFAAAEAEHLGRTDVTSNIEEMQSSFSGLVDIIVQVPIAGRDFLQWIGDGAAGIGNLTKLVGALTIQFELNTGQITQAEAVQQINNLTTDEAAQKTADLTAKKEADTAATEAAKKAAAEAAQANKDFATALGNLNTVMAGAVGKENADYSQSQDDLAAKMAKLKEQIDLYSAANGQAIPPAENLSALQNEQALAAFNLQQAQENLTKAQGDLATSKAQGLGLDELFTGNILKAQTAIDQQTAALAKANDAVNAGQGGVANYSGYIKKLEDQYGELSTQYDTNAQAHEMAKRKIIFGMVEIQVQSAITSGQISAEDAPKFSKALDQMALSWGLVDQATLDTQANISNALGKLTSGDAPGFQDALNEMTTPLRDDAPVYLETFQTKATTTFGSAAADAKAAVDNGIQPLIDKTKDDLAVALGTTAKGAVDDFGKSLKDQNAIGGPLYEYVVGLSRGTAQAKEFAAAIRSIPPVPGGAASGGSAVEPGTPYLGPHAGGGSFTVPGYGSSDQMFRIGLTPGEQVDITPANQVSNGKSGARNLTIIQNIYNTIDYAIAAEKTAQLMRNS